LWSAGRCRSRSWRTPISRSLAETPPGTTSRLGEATGVARLTIWRDSAELASNATRNSAAAKTTRLAARQCAFGLRDVEFNIGLSRQAAETSW
jgi:hypothetical protein